MSAVRLARLTLCLAVFILCIKTKTANAETQNFLDNASGWSVIGETDRYYATFSKGVSSSGLIPELAFLFNVPNRRFAIFFTRPPNAPATGPLSVSISFRPASLTKPLIPMKLTATGTDKLTAVLSDADVANWTHGFTAGASMTVAFTNNVWTFDLAGTTPAISTMAGAMGAAGIDGLPPPWEMTGYATVPPPVGMPDTAAQDRAAGASAQKRQLEIANAEAAKARADAQRAQAEAEKARAEADRAQAQAQIEADSKAKAAEETRAITMRLAEEQRRVAAQVKAEQDARGTEP